VTTPPSAVVAETVDVLTTCIDDLSTKSGTYAERMLAPGAAQAATSELASAAKSVVAETGAVADEVYQKIEAGTYDADAMVDAMARLSAIALSGGLGVMKAMMKGAQAACGTPSPAKTIEHQQTVEPTSVDRHLVVDPPFSRGGTTEVIPSGRITLVPSILAAGKTTFAIRVDASGIATGLYSGGIRDSVGSVVAHVDLLL
jgi:hypothetical protein